MEWEPALPNLPADETLEPLETTRFLEEVRYQDGRPSFVIKHDQGLTFYRGHAGWSISCNRTGGSYETSGDKLTIDAQGMTLLACGSPARDVHYEQVTRYAIEGRRLTLYTPTQTYLLTRFPHSRISAHGWNLYSIVDLKAGFALQVNRFRTVYEQLRFNVEADRSFRFMDLDGDVFTGSVEIGSGGRIRLTLDAKSRHKISSKPRQMEVQPDSTQRRAHAYTEELYPTTYADLVEWPQVKAYRIFRDEVFLRRGIEESEVLELYTGRQVYRFIPRG